MIRTADIIRPECQWKFELFYCRVFNKNGSRQQTLSRQGAIIVQAKRPGLGKFLQNELLKSAISSSLSEIMFLDQ